MTLPASVIYTTNQPGQATFQYSTTPLEVATDPTSLSSGKYLLGLVLNKTMSLLITMISTMQSVAVQQANRLTFLTSWQNAYTSQMNGVHTFAANNGDAYISDVSDTSSTTRQDLNSVNSNYTEQMRSNNTVVADAAKALQTNVSQTQSAVNQQSSLLGSLMQQLQTMLSAVYNNQ